MAIKTEMIGKKFGRLIVIERAGTYKDGHILWLCRCSCGNETKVQSNNLKKKNGTKSCGCLVGEAARKRNKKMGPWNKGLTYSNKKTFKNKRWWAIQARKELGNKCQECGWDKAPCDVHHIKPISEGGEHSLDNAIILCPNCHRIEHCK